MTQNIEKNVKIKEKKKTSLKEENQKLRDIIKEKEDKLLRRYADFQNYQKRMHKEIKLKEDEIKERYISELIDLKELLIQAYKDKDPKKGLKFIIKKFEKFFKNENIQYIDCIGKKFDHNIHHAISTIEKENCEENIVVDEIKKGYIIDDKLLRPSQVIVAKKKEIEKEWL